MQIFGYVTGSTIRERIFEYKPPNVDPVACEFDLHEEAAAAFCGMKIDRYYGDLDIIRASIAKESEKMVNPVPRKICPKQSSPMNLTPLSCRRVSLISLKSLPARFIACSKTVLSRATTRAGSTPRCHPTCAPSSGSTAYRSENALATETIRVTKRHGTSAGLPSSLRAQRRYPRWRRTTDGFVKRNPVEAGRAVS